MKHLRLKIHGRVQGVFYRAETCKKARQLGLHGWVRNCADGSVELLAGGAQERLDALRHWCRSGPPAAEVTDIEEEWSDEPLAEVGFFARY